MNKLTRKYLSGESINIYHVTTDVEVLPDGTLENSPDDLYIETWAVEQKLKDFFDNLEAQLTYEMHELIACTDKSFTIRREEEGNYYREETFNFSDSDINNSSVKERFDQYIEFAKRQYPFYEQDYQEVQFARNISNVIYNRTSLDIPNLQDIPEFQEFYERYKEKVELTLRKRLKEKVWPECLDFLARYVTLLTINFAFLIKHKLPVIIAIDVAIGLVITTINIAGQRLCFSSIAHKRMNEGINNFQNSKLNGYSGFKNKVLKAIKTDIELTEHMRYDGYEEILYTLYELADTVLNDGTEVETTNEKTDKMPDVLNKLVDIEQIICIQMNYNGEINAEILLNEYLGNQTDTHKESNEVSAPTDEKRLLFQ